MASGGSNRRPASMPPTCATFAAAGKAADKGNGPAACTRDDGRIRARNAPTFSHCVDRTCLTSTSALNLPAATLGDLSTRTRVPTPACRPACVPATRAVRDEVRYVAPAVLGAHKTEWTRADSRQARAPNPDLWSGRRGSNPFERRRFTCDPQKPRGTRQSRATRRDAE